MNNQSIATYVSNAPHPTLGSETKYSHLFPKTERFLAKNPEYSLPHPGAPKPSTPTTPSSPTA